MKKEKIKTLIDSNSAVSKRPQSLTPNLSFLILNSSSGSSTLELLIAFAVLTLSITAGILVVFSNQSVSVDIETNNEALSKAEAILEQARADSRSDFASVVSSSSVLASGPISYTRTLNVTDVDSFTKRIQGTVAWLAGSRPLNITLNTLLTDPSSALGGDTCNQALSGDWTHPQLLGTADVGQNNNGTDVYAVGKKAYVTADASFGNKPDFYVVDVTDPTIPNLPILGSVDTGPGLAAVHVAGKYAYVANTSRTAQLQIIDISDPTNPLVAKSFKLTNVTGAGSQAIGNSIFYSNKKVYLGLTKTATGPEFDVIDVADFLNNPVNNPVLVGSWDAGTTINGITIKNNIAYLATPWPSSNPPTRENLSLLDVSDPASGISRLNTFTAPDPSTMSGESVYISKDGHTLYLGRGGLNGAHNPQFFSLDVSNPSSISQINSKYIPTSNNVSVNAMTVRNNLAFLWTNDANLNFQIWDLNNLSSLTPYGALNTQQSAANGFDCDGNIIYTAQKSRKALQIIGPQLATAALTLGIHDVSHNNISAANIGDTVHAALSAAGPVGTPTGKVDFTFYTSSDCSSGGTADLSNPFILGGSGIIDPSSGRGPLNAGSYSFKAHYEGDVNYNPVDSPCETLTVN